MPSHYSEIGTLLRSARKEMHLTLDQAAAKVHIRARYLEALEQGNFTELPGLPYAKGYLQSYATFLRLDKDEILRRFEQVEAMIGKQNFFFPQVFSREKTPSQIIITGALILALLLYLGWSAARAPREEISLIEAPPQKPPLSVMLLPDGACLEARDSLYPPCYAAGRKALPAPEMKRPAELPWLRPRKNEFENDE